MGIEELTALTARLQTKFSGMSQQYGCIVYVFDREYDGKGTGFHKNCDMGDAMVAIERIAKQFGINLQAWVRR